MVILVLLPMLVHGQGNLVPNPSFEERVECPSSISQYYLATPWSNTGSICSPDYYNSCNLGTPSGSPHMGVPENGSGHQFAFSGVSYMGIFTFAGFSSPQGREYLQVTLTEALQADIKYMVSFHVSLADKFWYAVGSFGAYFSENLIQRENGDVLLMIPQIQSSEGIIFDDKENWILIQDTFSSRNGGERYLIIGNFHADEESNITLVDSGLNGYNKSYYYIDDVSVMALDSVSSDGEEQEGVIFSIHPNPATSFIHVCGQRPRRIRLLDMSGKAIVRENITTDRHTLHLSGIPPGLYLLEAEDDEGNRAVQKVVVQ